MGSEQSYIRKADRQDVSRIAELLVFNNRVNYWPIFRDEKYSFKELQVIPIADEYLSDQKRLESTWVYDDGVVKGMLQIENDEIKKLYVDICFQNNGIGARLLEYAVKERGAVYLWALEKNVRAIKFYQKHGFHITKERKFEEGTTEYLVKLTRRAGAGIRKAALKDIEQIEKSYVELLLHEQEHGAYTAWKLGVYPTRKTAEKGIRNGNLYVMERDGEICASIIANQIQPREYGDIKWKYDAPPDEILVIHLLCVRPSKKGHGIGKDLVEFIIEEGKRLNCRAVRLDTGGQNKPAVALYEKLGFELAGTAAMEIGGEIFHSNHLFFEKNIR